jgi:predicted ATPase
MKLTSFRITDYRSINDTGDIEVHPRVTCLVGKNEAGKTAVLQALRRINPVHAANFNLTMDFPRNRLIQHQRARKQSGAVAPIVARATFELDVDDASVIESTLGEGALRTRDVTVTVGYEAKAHGSLSIDESVVVRHLLRDTTWAERAAEFSSVAALLDALKDAREDEAARQLVSKVTPMTSTPLSDQAWKLVAGRLPRLLYFDEYAVMKGQATLQALSADAGSDEHLRTLRALLNLAGVTPQELLNDGNYQQVKALLEATSADITREVFEYWRQNPDLEVEFDVHRPQGTDAASTFYVQIKNRRHGNTVPFDERSRGFVWFFSFLVTFHKVAGEGKPVIVLLDEPGLNLHGKAQADLLRFIEERLAPKHQVLYTTHSPFMVDAQRFERVRTVEDVRGKGTIVSADCMTTDADTLFPLQAALGYDVAQSLFVGPNCLLVEGPSELLYLQAFSRLSKLRGGTGLDERWVVTPVGGADKLAAFVALMGGNKLNVAALMDVAKQDRQRVDNLLARHLLESNHLVRVSQFCERAEADIEDLLPPALYVGAVRECLATEGAALDLGSLPQGPRIVKRIESALGRRFDHYAAAVRILPILESAPDDDAIRRFDALFATVNALLPRS